MTEALRPRTVGELIGQTLTVSFSAFWKLLLIQILIWLPLLGAGLLAGTIVLLVAAPSDPVIARTVGDLSGFATIILFSFILGPLAQAATVIAVADRFTGRETSVLDCYRFAIPRILSLLGLAILVGAVITMGMMLCLLPGIFLAIRLWIAVPVLVIERRTIGGALNRSWDLTRGNFWRLFGFGIVIFFMFGILSLVIQQPLTMLIEMVESIRVALVLSLVNQAIGSIISGIFGMVAAVVVYFELRTRKEAFDLEGLVGFVDEIAPPRGGAEFAP